MEVAGDAGWLPPKLKGLEGAEVGVTAGAPKLKGVGWLANAGLAGVEEGPVGAVPKRPDPEGAEDPNENGALVDVGVDADAPNENGDPAAGPEV